MNKFDEQLWRNLQSNHKENLRHVTTRTGTISGRSKSNLFFHLYPFPPYQFLRTPSFLTERLVNPSEFLITWRFTRRSIHLIVPFTWIHICTYYTHPLLLISMTMYLMCPSVTSPSNYDYCMKRHVFDCFSYSTCWQNIFGSVNISKSLKKGMFVFTRTR